jgi:hypothetical protein
LDHLNRADGLRNLAGIRTVWKFTGNKRRAYSKDLHFRVFTLFFQQDRFLTLGGMEIAKTFFSNKQLDKKSLLSLRPTKQKVNMDQLRIFNFSSGFCFFWFYYGRSLPAATG